MPLLLFSLSLFAKELIHIKGDQQIKFKCGKHLIHMINCINDPFIQHNNKVTTRYSYVGNNYLWSLLHNNSVITGFTAGMVSMFLSIKLIQQNLWPFIFTLPCLASNRMMVVLRCCAEQDNQLLLMLKKKNLNRKHLRALLRSKVKNHQEHLQQLQQQLNKNRTAAISE